jgi:DNA-binding NarL/FixJ family response regulator
LAEIRQQEQLFADTFYAMQEALLKKAEAERQTAVAERQKEAAERQKVEERRQKEEAIRLLLQLGVPKAEIAQKLGLSEEDLQRI